MHRRIVVLIYVVMYLITSLILFSIIFFLPELRSTGDYDNTNVKTHIILSLLGGIFPTFGVMLFSRFLKK